MLHNYPPTREISVLSFRHCDIGGVKICTCFLVNNIPSSGFFQEELNDKVIRKLYSILKVNERCIEGCAPPR